MTFAIRLFGKFTARHNFNPEDVEGFEILETHRKVRELLGYLLLYRRRAHSREMLADALWSEAKEPKKLLRHNLWLLKMAVTSACPTEPSLLVIGQDWIEFNAEADIWVDLIEFERIWDQLHGVLGEALDSASAALLQQAITLYAGQLMPDNYMDWCVRERDRVHGTYIKMLERLIGYDECHGDYESALAHGTQILDQDPARERTHRKMMRLYYLNGDRSSALRQYDACVDALESEFGLPPDARTRALYEQIRRDQLAAMPALAAGSDAGFLRVV